MPVWTDILRCSILHYKGFDGFFLVHWKWTQRHVIFFFVFVQIDGKNFFVFKPNNENQLLLYELHLSLYTNYILFQVDQTPSLGDHLGTDLTFSPDTGFSDVTLVCGERHFGCHKYVLSKRSDVFAAMFSHSDTEESKTNKVRTVKLSLNLFVHCSAFIKKCNFFINTIIFHEV